MVPPDAAPCSPDELRNVVDRCRTEASFYYMDPSSNLNSSLNLIGHLSSGIHHFLSFCFENFRFDSCRDVPFHSCSGRTRVSSLPLCISHFTWFAAFAIFFWHRLVIVGEAIYSYRLTLGHRLFFCIDSICLIILFVCAY